MKITVLVVLVLATSSFARAGEAPPFKQFIGGALTSPKGENYGYTLCQQDDTLHFLVMTPGVLTATKLGAFEPRVETANARSKNPKAKLLKAPRQEVDLFASPHQLYQIEMGGVVRSYEERVSLREFHLFMKSNPDAHTIEALVAFVRELRSREGKETQQS